MSRNDGVNFRHPFAQMDETENLTKHWPCVVSSQNALSRAAHPTWPYICIYVHVIRVCMYVCNVM